MTDPTNTDDIIDSRDIISRIDELEGQRDDAVGEDDAELYPPLDEDEEQELEDLQALANDASGGDWDYGATLIHDSYFETYARQLAEDIGLLEDSNTWPGRCIDWAQAAEELQQDYSSVSFAGEDYWVRA